MDHHEIEKEIRRLLVEEKHAVALSNKLFSPGGLFSQLAPTKEQRKIIVDTELFKQAQAKLSELERVDAAEFSEVAKDYLDQRKLRQAKIRIEESPTT